jgi:hypothetical protein
VAELPDMKTVEVAYPHIEKDDEPARLFLAKAKIRSFFGYEQAVSPPIRS